MNKERKQIIIEKCLDCLIEKGLTQTTTKDLCSAAGLQNGGIYYYFTSKEEIIEVCSEEAIKRIENKALGIAFNDVKDIENMDKSLKKVADEMMPVMNFLVSCRMSKEYGERVKPSLCRLAGRYVGYSERIAKVLNCDVEESKPFVYMLILALNNYMIFSEEALFIPQIELVKRELLRIADKYNKQ